MKTGTEILKYVTEHMDWKDGGSLEYFKDYTFEDLRFFSQISCFNNALLETTVLGNKNNRFWEHMPQIDNTYFLDHIPQSSNLKFFCPDERERSFIEAGLRLKKDQTRDLWDLCMMKKQTLQWFQEGLFQKLM